MPWIIAFLALAGCSQTDGAPADATPPDAAPLDAVVLDAHLPDAAPPDSTPPDAAPVPPVLALNEIDCRDEDGVEVANLGAAADLSGWSVAGTPLEGTLEADSLGWFPTARIVCGEPVELVGPDGAVDEATPPLDVAASTWGRLPDGTGRWARTRPTPGAPNAPFVAPGADLFELRVRQIDLAIGEQAWTVLVRSPAERVDASITIDGAEATFARLRVTGRDGRFKAITQKPSLTLEFEAAPYHGLRALELDALTLDAGVITRRLAAGVLEAAGIPAPRSGFAWVRINDEDYGLYATAEVRDADFVARHFSSTRHLFASSGRDVAPADVWRFDAELGPDQRPELERLAALPDEGFYEASGDYVVWSQVVRALAAEVAIGSVDGYGPARRASWLHFDALGRLRLLPGGTDHALRTPVPAHRSPARLLVRCLAAPECRAAYDAALLEVATAIDREWPVDALVEIVRPWVEMDPRGLASVEMFDGEVARIRAFLSQRPARLVAYARCVTSGGDDCDDGAGPNCAGRPDDDPACRRCVDFERGGQTYHVCPTPLTYPAARALCQRVGGDLFLPDSRGENDWINRHARSVRAQDYWIGLDDEDEEGTFAAVDGSTRAFDFWADGEPNDGGEDEDCAHLRADGRWNDARCGARLGVVCESACDAAATDVDGDGAGGCGVDCDDADPDLHPGATDVCGDAIDQDCSGAADDRDCACTTVFRDGHRYLFCPGRGTFDEARAACQAEGADLVIIDDADENLMLWRTAIQRQPQRWWIGVSDTVAEGQYRWWDGTKPRFHAWSRGEPNDAGRREDCGHFWQDRPAWNDIPCSARHGAICEE